MAPLKRNLEGHILTKDPVTSKVQIPSKKLFNLKVKCNVKKVNIIPKNETLATFMNLLS